MRRDGKILSYGVSNFDAGELADAIIVAAEAVGAIVLQRSWDRAYILGRLDAHSADELATQELFPSALLSQVDAVCQLTSAITQGAPPSPEQRAKLPHLLRAVTEFQRKLRDAGVPHLEVSVPSSRDFEGFASAVPVAGLGGLGVPVVADIGSGLLATHPRLPDEPDATSTLRAGADLVTASGDKLLGGPQCGLLLGAAALVERLRRHPFARALTPDLPRGLIARLLMARLPRRIETPWEPR